MTTELHIVRKTKRKQVSNEKGRKESARAPREKESESDRSSPREKVGNRREDKDFYRGFGSILSCRVCGSVSEHSTKRRLLVFVFVRVCVRVVYQRREKKHQFQVFSDKRKVAFRVAT